MIEDNRRTLSKRGRWRFPRPLTTSRIFLLLLGLLALAVACGDEGGPGVPSSPTPSPTPTAGKQITIAPDAPIVIGISTPLSGDTGQFGRDIRDGAILGAEDFGLVKGHQVQVVADDEGCPDPEKADAVANRFVADPAVVAVIGTACFFGQAHAIYEENAVVRISPSSTTPTLTEQGHSFVFRTAWRDDVQGRLQARYALDILKASTAFIVDDSEAYGEGLAKEFEEAYTAAGGTVKGRARIALGDADFTPVVEEAVQSGAALLLFEGFVPEATLLIQQLRNAGFQGAFLGPDGIFDQEAFARDGGPASEGAFVTASPPLPEAIASAFRAKFGREAGTPFIGQAYDAMQILLKAIDSVAEEQADGSLIIDTGRLRDAVAATSHQGLTGAISFDEKGDRAGESPAELGLALWKVEGGRFVPVR